MRTIQLLTAAFSVATVALLGMAALRPTVRLGAVAMALVCGATAVLLWWLSRQVGSELRLPGVGKRIPALAYTVPPAVLLVATVFLDASFVRVLLIATAAASAVTMWLLWRKARAL